MERVMSAFYWPTVMWVEYPALTFVPVIVFGMTIWRLGRSGRWPRGLIVAFALWLVYAVYETVMFFWSRTVIAPIRIDLILLGPLMYIVTAIGVVSWWKAKPNA